MRILLINPSTPSYMPNKEYMLSTGMLSLAAVLQRDGFEVTLLDLNVHRPWEWDEATGSKMTAELIARLALEFRPALIGIGCLFSGQFQSVLRYATTCKGVLPEVPIVIGGMHPTIYPREILSHCPVIDYVVIGEGELQMVSLAKSLREGSKDPAGTDGIGWRSNNEVLIAPKKAFIANLDELPLPAYDLVDSSNYEHDTSHWHNPKGHAFGMTVPIVSSRSCPTRCNFCSMFMVMGPRIRFRSPGNVVDELELLYHRYGQRHFSFMDDNVNLNKRHILGICSEIRRRGLDIQFETPNGLFTAALDREVMDAMIGAGWVRGAIAIESGSDYIRNQIMGKHLSREKILEVTRLAKEYPGLYFKAYFIIGMPEDTRETLMESYKMIEELDIDDPYVTNLVPFPGTRVFEQARRDGLFIDDFDLENLWRMEGFHYHDNKRFYVKPYRMELSELEEFRARFDGLLADHKRRKKLERERARATRSEEPLAICAA